MNTAELYKSLLREKNLREYGDIANNIPFLDGPELLTHIEERNGLLEKAGRLGAQTCYNGTKIDCRNLSPGCIACAEGTWSCLFINGICNASCFYCPAEQNDAGQPVTNTLEFPDPEEYISYLDRFVFTGVSISGGEPLLSFEPSLRYISAIRRHFGKKIYIWLYTNGILATREALVKLKDSGLDEIRFDIGATGYKIDKPALAARIIPTVTVEIPAVPEDHDRVNELVPKLAAAGVKHLNLRYYDTRFTGAVSYKNPFSEIRLAGGRKIFVERIQCLADYTVGGAEKELFIRLFLKDCSMGPGNRVGAGGMIDALGLSAGKKEIWLKILDFERPGMGLQE